MNGNGNAVRFSVDERELNAVHFFRERLRPCQNGAKMGENDQKVYKIVKKRGNNGQRICEMTKIEQKW